MNIDNQISYVEFPTRDIAASKMFFFSLFNWKFQDFGADYTCFANEGIRGGFYLAEQVSRGGPLLVLYSEHLEEMQEKIEHIGCTINKTIYAFPGGRRFHFIEPGGNELAIWSDK